MNEFCLSFVRQYPKPFERAATGRFHPLLRYVCQTLLKLVLTWFILTPSAASAQNLATDSLLQLANSAHFPLQRARLLSVLSEEYYTLGKFAESIENSNHALDIYKKYQVDTGVAKEMFNLGRIYSDMGEYPRAMKYLLGSLEIYEQTKNIEGQANVKNSIGLVFYYSRKYEEAIENFTAALSVYQKLEDKKRIAYLYNNMGMVYFDKRDFSNSLSYHLRGLEIKKTLEGKNNLASSLNNIGAVYLEMKEYDKALDYFTQALEIKLASGNKKSIAITQRNIADLYFRTGKLTEAEKYALVSLENAIAGQSMLHKSEALLQLSQIYYAGNNFKKAFDYTHLYINVKDSIFNTESDERIEKLRILYEVDKKDRDIQLANAKVKVLEQDTLLIKNRNRFLWLLLFSSGIILVMLFIAIRLKSKTIIQNKLAHENHVRMQELTIRNQQLENMHLKDEVELKNRELSTVTVSIYTKNEILNTLNEKIENISSTDAKIILQLNELKKTIAENMSLEKDWQQFKYHFEQVHPHFFTKLEKQYPQLTMHDLKHCAYIKMNLSTKEIARLMNIVPGSVQISRVRLKKKLELNHEDNLPRFISSF